MSHLFYQPLTETQVRELLSMAHTVFPLPSNTKMINVILIRLKNGVVGSGSCPCVDAVTCPIIREREARALLYLAWLRGKGEHESAEVMAAWLHGLMQQPMDERCRRSIEKEES